MKSFPSLSTDQVAAFVSLARAGTLRAAAGELHLTEQGVRNRLVALENRLGVELYCKRQGPRHGTPLTRQGREFLAHALAFLDRARDLADLFRGDERREVHIGASQYLIVYLLIPALRRFRKAFPHIHIWLSSHTEHEIEQVLLENPEVELGVAAPYEPSPEIEYRHLFSMDWSLIAPRQHPLLRQRRIALADLVDLPLILFERGSTGRQHITDAFHGQGLSPEVYMETTNTEIIVRMVEAGLGVSIVPLLRNGSVTRGRKVAIRGLGDQIRPIHSGVLVRRGGHLCAAGSAFLDFLVPYGRAMS